MISIVDENPGHYSAIRQLTINAFAGSEHGYNGEADLIDTIRARGGRSLSLVATANGEVLGHILFSSP
jgi:putative acetyltransferase